MNDINNDNLDVNLPIGPSQNTLAMTEEFLSSDLQTLTAKYGNKKLLDKIFIRDENYYSVVDELKDRQHQLIVLFWPKDQNITLSPQKRTEILNFLGTLNAENTVDQADAGLKKIDPNLALPAEVNFGNIQPKASTLSQGFRKIQTLLLDSFAPDYLADTLNFYRMDEARFQNVNNRVDNVSQKIANQLDQLANNSAAPIDENMINEALDFLGELGRTKLFVSEEKTQKNLGQLTAIYSNMEVAIQAAATLKKQTEIMPENLSQAALEEIKKILQPDIQI